MTATTLHRRLERLIGDRFNYLGEVWVLIEVLADLDAVVLRRCTTCPSLNMQTNAYGQPTRRTDETLTLPISGAEETAYSEDLLILLEGRQPSRRADSLRD